MTNIEADLPRIFLNRVQWVRLTIVGLLVVFAIGRVVPDLVRTIFPLQVFGYVTDRDGVVVATDAHAARPEVHTHSAARHGKPNAARHAPAPPDELADGDRVLIAHIKPFDRKPGIAGVGFTYDNPDRTLPIERHGRLHVLHLTAVKESIPSRVFAVLRIALFVLTVGLGAILFLMKPSIATGAFFFFCLGGEAPSTYLDLIIPNPWRQGFGWLGDMLRGAASPALLLFALCLIEGDGHAPRNRSFIAVCIVLAVVLGALQGYATWLITYAGRPAMHVDMASNTLSTVVTALTTVVFGVGLFRARGIARRRIVWIVAAFAFALAARLASEDLPPRLLPPIMHGVLVSTTIVPVVAVWIAVIRQRFFDVDFVVSRAIVYVALAAAAFATVTTIEELGTYNFVNSVDVPYSVIFIVSAIAGALTAKLNPFLHHLVDRFIFRNRRDQRRALELIEGYILDAETTDDVYRALLADATHALQLSFGGFLARLPNGDYALSYAHDWPTDCITQLRAGDELTQKLTRTRGAITFSSKDTALVARAFPGERLTFAAPVFLDRSVLGIVMYGHNVSGLDLDPEEREHLVRVVAHASIALGSIELARYRSGAVSEEPLPVGVRAV